MEREGLKTLPPFVRCDLCSSEYYTSSNIGGIRGCPKCAHSPLPGWLPRWYTPEQWIEYVRRENNMPNYELPDDMPIWFLMGDETGHYDKWWPEQYDYAFHNGKRLRNHAVIRTDAGRPPADWRPE